MHKLLFAGVFAITLSGCASFTTAFNTVVADLTSPQAQQAFSSLKAGAAAVNCAVANASQVIQTVNAQIKNKQNAVIARDAQNVYVASAAACAWLGGQVTANVIIPVTAIPAAVPTPAATPTPAVTTPATGG